METGKESQNVGANEDDDESQGSDESDETEGTDTESEAEDLEASTKVINIKHTANGQSEQIQRNFNQ